MCQVCGEEGGGGTWVMGLVWGGGPHSVLLVMASNQLQLQTVCCPLSHPHSYVPQALTVATC